VGSFLTTIFIFFKIVYIVSGNILSYGRSMTMQIESYRANQKTMWYHISQCIKKSKTGKIQYLLECMEIVDLNNDCWTTTMTSDKSWAIEARTWYNGQWIDNEILDRRTRQRTKVTVRNYIALQYFKHRRDEAMRQSLLENISHYEVRTNVRSPSEIFDKISLSDEDSLLIWWQLGTIDDDHVCKAMGCSLMTVYRRWNKLKNKIVKEYNTK
jgi:hypothetical protein